MCPAGLSFLQKVDGDVDSVEVLGRLQGAGSGCRLQGRVVGGGCRVWSTGLCSHTDTRPTVRTATTANTITSQRKNKAALGLKSRS